MSIADPSMSLPLILLLGLLAWAFVLAVTLALLRAAGRADRALEARAPTERSGAGLARRQGGILDLLLELSFARDPALARHAAAVAHYANELATAAGLPEREREVVHAAGLLHDIGKQALPDAVLVRETALDADARQIVERHPALGAQLLRELPELHEVADAIEAHHERIDGTGYPVGLAGEQIPRAARIVAIAEAYDALTAPDSYRGAMSHAQAAEELRRAAGTQFDAELLELFLHVVTAPGVSRQRRFRPSFRDELRAIRLPSRLFNS